MNYRTILNGLTIAAVLAIAATGCKKEEVAVVSDNTAKYSEASMADDADNQYNSDIIIEGSETTEFGAENDALPEVYLMSEADMDEAGFKRGIGMKFLLCLKNLNLSDTQTMKLRMAMRAYQECKFTDIRNHRDTFAKLHYRVNMARKALIAKLMDKQISKADFDAAMKNLRAEFVEALRKIKMHHGKALRICYEKFLRHVRLVLTDAQWRAFVDCYR